jgi:chromosome segregation ATPase
MFEKLRKWAEEGNQSAADRLEAVQQERMGLAIEMEQATADLEAAEGRLANMDQELAAKAQENINAVNKIKADAALRQEEHDTAMAAITERTAQHKENTRAAVERKEKFEAESRALQAELDSNLK